MHAFAAQPDEAERLLDDLAQQTVEQARRYARDPAPQVALVEYTRRLSQQ